MYASCWILKQWQKLRAGYDLHRPTATDILLLVRSHFFMVPQPPKSVPGWGTNSRGRRKGDISPRKRCNLGLCSELQLRLVLHKDVSSAASDTASYSTFRGHWLPAGNGYHGSSESKRMKICFDLKIIDLSSNFTQH